MMRRPRADRHPDEAAHLYGEMAAWLDRVHRLAIESADHIEHEIVPAGTESLEISLRALAEQTTRTLAAVRVVQANL